MLYAYDICIYEGGWEDAFQASLKLNPKRTVKENHALAKVYNWPRIRIKLGCLTLSGV